MQPRDGKPPAYDRDYYREVSGLDRLRPLTMAWWSVRFYARLCRRLLRRTGGRTVLEVGCAHGFVLERLAREFDCTGVDVSQYALAAARERVPRASFHAADLERELPPEIGERSYDLLLARYVFEHLEQPGGAIERLARCLGPEGRMLFAVPDPASPGRRMKGERWFGYGDPTHVSLLEMRQWEELLGEAGLEIELAFSDGLWDVPYVGGVPALLQYPVFSLPTMLSVVLARPLIPAGKGENLIAVARRRSGGRKG